MIHGSRKDAPLELVDPETQMAWVLYEQGRALTRHYPGIDVSNPKWNIMLFLFIQRNRDVTVGETCEAALAPRTSGLFTLKQLRRRGLIEYAPCLEDRRSRYVRLREPGIHRMRSALQDQIRLLRPRDCH